MNTWALLQVWLSYEASENADHKTFTLSGRLDTHDMLQACSTLFHAADKICHLNKDHFQACAVAIRTRLTCSSGVHSK